MWVTPKRSIRHPISPPSSFLFLLPLKITATSPVIFSSTFGAQKLTTTATPLNAIVVKNTVLYASALAYVYARCPTARISGVKPLTALNPAGVPNVSALKNEGTLEAGRPACTRAGGTWEGMVCFRRLLSTTV